MSYDPLFLLVIFACLTVLAVLIFGVVVFAKGGEFNRKHANKIMRLRLFFQLIAVVLIMLYIWLRSGG